MKTVLVIVLVAFLTGCTSLGHEGRSAPKIVEGQFDKTQQAVALDSDDGGLSIAVERELGAHGFTVVVPNGERVTKKSTTEDRSYTELTTRYVVRVRSTDFDICVPEGSRQLSSFSISVLDAKTHKRVFLISGEYGCTNTITSNLINWMAK